MAVVASTPAVSVAALLILLHFSANVHSSSAATNNIDYIKASCKTTQYPRLCYKSLSTYASKIKTNPKTLASTALNLTLSATKSTSAMIKKMSKSHVNPKPREAAAMADCVEEVGYAVDELRDSIKEMNHPPKGEDFELQMDNIETWVSAALTYEDTCMDGFSGKAMNGDIKTTVRRHVLKVAHLTSNALALVNNYASSVKSVSP